MTPVSTARIAAALVHARWHAQPLDGFPLAVPASLEEAYAVQGAALQKCGEAPVGWKIALIAPAWRAQYPAERLVGPILARNVHSGGAGLQQCAVFAGGFAAAEAEIVLRLAHDAEPGKLEWTRAEALALVASAHAGAEIASSPLATINDIGPGAVVADFGNNWGVIVGPRIDGWRDAGRFDCEVLVDDAVAGRANVGFDNAVDALRFALGCCAGLGRPLREGALLSTGALTGVHDVRVGQQARLRFGPHGEVAFVARAQVPLVGTGS